MVTKDNTSDSESSQSNLRGRANSYDSTDSDDSIRTLPGELEELLSQELMRMSITDRNLINEEIHGVRCMAVEETPGLIRQSLQAFQKELDNDEPQGGIRISEKKVYLKLLQRYRERSSFAAASGSTYTNYAIDDDDFRLRFLRCERFNPSKAARRFCNYLDCAHHHFGELTLERPVRITDFSRDEIKTFRKGYLQFLPFRDSSGRRVFTMLGGLGAEVDITLRDKLFFYMFDVATRDSVESQQKGMIMLRFFKNVAAEKNKGTDQLMVNFKRKNDISKAIKSAARVMKSTPTRIVACHMDVPNHPLFRLIGKHMFLKVFSGSDFDLPSRFVLGTGKGELEFRYRLKSFGIPVQLLPLTETHVIKATFHNQWIETRRKLEYQEFGKDERDCDDTDDNYDDYDDYDEADEYIKQFNQGGNVAGATLVECPGLNDVVFRKGSRVTSIENPGNRFFRDLIRTFLDEKEKETQKLRQRQEEVMTHITKQIQHSKCAADSDVNTFVIRNESNRGGSTSNDIYATCTRNKKASTTPPTTPPTASASASALAFETTKAMTRTPNSSSIAKKNTEKGFCDWLVDYIQNNCNGRFLEWEPRICGWVVMTNKMKIRRKVSITLYNWGKRLKTLAAAARLENSEALKKRTAPIQHGNNAIMNGKESSNVIHSASDDENKGGHDNDMSYAFMNEWRRSTSQEQWEFSCRKTSATSNNDVQNVYANYVETILDTNKRARKDADYVYPRPVFSLPPSLS